MGINDLPQVDGASANNDKAKSRLTSCFSIAAGFIASEQFQDFGCDYKVQLVEDGATNWFFDIQLKSVERPRIISDGKFISFPLKTSTLNYLLRTEPIYGLLVIYDVGTDTLYFDFVNVLYKRALEAHETKDWLDNGQVSLHVPASNILNEDMVRAIHGHFLYRFKNLGKLNREFGGRFGLTSHLATETSQDANTQNIDDALSELRSYGAARLMQRDMRRVYDLLERLPRNQVVADKALSLTAVLAYSEVGRIADSTYYLERVLKRFELNDSERRMVSFIALKNELVQGEIDRKAFVDSAGLLLDGAGVFERLSIRLNILYYELNSLQGLEPVPERLVDEYNALDLMICKVEDETQRMYIRAWNLDNLAMIAGQVRREDMNRLAIFKRFGVDMSLELRQKSSDRSIYLHQYLHQQFTEIVGFTMRTQEFTLTAMVMLSHMRFWLGAEMDILAFGNEGVSKEKIRSEMEECIDLARETAQMLLELNRFRQAYAILGMTFELLLICTQVYDFKGLPDIGKIREQMKELEVDLELPTFVSQMQPLIDKKLSRNEKKESGMHGMKGLNDTQIRTYARYVLESGCFPNAKPENLVSEMMALRIFSERAEDDRYELRLMKINDKLMAYVYPSQFYIRDKQTGIESLPGTDMAALLDSFGI